jgi:hypothetical protein
MHILWQPRIQGAVINRALSETRAQYQVMLSAGVNQELIRQAILDVHVLLILSEISKFELVLLILLHD